MPTAMSVCARVKGRGIVVATRGGEEGWVGASLPAGVLLRPPPTTLLWRVSDEPSRDAPLAGDFGALFFGGISV